MGVSRRAYARHRGVAENAVRKAIAAGRIELEPDGTIDVVKADQAWTRRTDPAQQRLQNKRDVAAARDPEARSSGDTIKPVPAVAVEAVRDTLREAGEPPAAGGMNYVTARTANEVIKAQERRLRLGKLKGELIDRAKATTTVFTLARRERDSWVQWPARVAALIAAELGVDAQRYGNGSRQACPTASRRALGRSGRVPVKRYDGAAEIVRAWSRGLTPDPLLTVSEWSDRYRILVLARGIGSRTLSDRAHALHARDHGCAVAVASGAADRVHEGGAGRRHRGRQ